MRRPRLPFEPDDCLWSFDTAALSVRLHATPEDHDPEDSFCFPEDIEFARRDDPAAWFCAWVVVYALDDDGEPSEVVAYDTLGGCSYNSFREFYTSHRDRDPMNRNCSIMRAAHPSGPNVSICHYFPSMVAEACSEAREALRARRAPIVRAA
jgi:hypothetical protein